MKGSLNSTHLSYDAQQSKLQVWGRYVRIPSKFLPCQILSGFGGGVCSCILLHKNKKEKEKKEEESPQRQF
jgi:hypothetical protein